MNREAVRYLTQMAIILSQSYGIDHEIPQEMRMGSKTDINNPFVNISINRLLI